MESPGAIQKRRGGAQRRGIRASADRQVGDHGCQGQERRQDKADDPSSPRCVDRGCRGRDRFARHATTRASVVRGKQPRGPGEPRPLRLQGANQAQQARPRRGCVRPRGIGFRSVQRPASAEAAGRRCDFSREHGAMPGALSDRPPQAQGEHQSAEQRHRPDHRSRAIQCVQRSASAAGTAQRQDRPRSSDRRRGRGPLSAVVRQR